MQSINLRGKKFQYINAQDLANKLSIPTSQARELINNKNNHRQNTRLIVNPNNQVYKVNLKDDYRGLLKQEFGLTHLQKLDKNITSKNNITKISKTQNYDSAKQLGEFAKVNGLIINVVVGLTWYDPDGEIPIDIDDIEERKFPIIFSNGAYNEYPNYRIDDNTVGNIEKVVLDGAIEYAHSSGAYIFKIYPDDQNYDKYKIYLPGEDAKYYIKYQILGLRNKKLELQDGILYETDGVLIYEDWLNVQNELTQGEDSCVINYMLNKYPKISKREIKKLEKDDGVTVDKLVTFLQDYQIAYKIYDGSEKIILESPDYNNNKSYARLTCIAHNNHLYPIEGRKLKRAPKNFENIKFIKDGFKKLQKYIEEKNKVPKSIKIGEMIMTDGDEVDVKINSFIIGKTKYIDNPDYEICKTLLEKLNMLDMIKDNIKIHHVLSLLEKEYLPHNINSFFPNMVKLKINPYSYCTSEEIDDDRNISVIDKNKCYTYSLYQLPYLIVCDWRTAQKRKINKKHKIGSAFDDIIDHHLYIIDPIEKSILLPDVGMYEGYHIKKCGMLEFTIVEEIVTTIVPNGYVKIIDLLKENLSEAQFKNMMNKAIGCMERMKNVDTKFKYETIINNDFQDRITGFYKKINEEYHLKFSYKMRLESPSCRLPINTQIKNMSRWLIYEKIKELNIKDKDILQIKTDSIAYYGEIPKNLDKTRKEISGWKQEEYKGLTRRTDPVKREITGVTFFPVENTELERALHCRYAGSGKTNYIINELIPELKQKKIDFIVLSPTHKSLQEYRKLGYKCDVLQKYTLRKEIPDEKYIIIDEVGMMDREGHDLLFIIKNMGCEYSVFGDYNQLLPFGTNKPFDDESYNKFLFNEIDRVYTNFRNNFPKEYYDELINSTDQEYLQRQVRKYSVKKQEDASIILCYRLDTKKKYNTQMLKYYKLNRFQIGTRHICATNKFLKEYPKLYKSTLLTLKNIEEEQLSSTYKKKVYILEDDEGNIFKINKKQFEAKHNFDLGYAINIHHIQGESIKSYYWAPEDNVFIDGRIAYLIISRLRQDLSEKTSLLNAYNMSKTKDIDLQKEINKMNNIMQHKNTSIDIIDVDTLCNN